MKNLRLGQLEYPMARATWGKSNQRRKGEKGEITWYNSRGVLACHCLRIQEEHSSKGADPGEEHNSRGGQQGRSTTAEGRIQRRKRSGILLATAAASGGGSVGGGGGLVPGEAL